MSKYIHTYIATSEATKADQKSSIQSRGWDKELCRCVCAERVLLLCPDLFPDKRGEAPPIPRGGSTETPPTGAFGAEERKKNKIYDSETPRRHESLMKVITQYSRQESAYSVH